MVRHLLLITLFSLLFWSCKSSPSTAPTEIAELPHGDTLEYEIVYEESFTPFQKKAFTLDSLSIAAFNAAQQGDFTQAHRAVSQIKEALTSTENTQLQDTILSNSQLMERVAMVYAQLLPSTYLDSVPDIFSSYVGRQQMYIAMTSIDSSDIDSLIPYNCFNQTHYNIPITYNLRVQQALAVMLSENRKKHMSTLLTRAHHFRPFMNEMFIEAGLPTDLTYLPIIESAFNAKAYSPAHASGLWQFIPSTGKMYKLREDYWVDERRDPIKSTEAAIKYFSRLYRMFDDWHLSLASYNCGEGRVSRTIKKTEGDAHTYWDLTLPTETMKYVPLFIATQIIAKNPQCFGIELRDTTEFPYDTIHVSDCIEMNKIAKALDVTPQQFKNMNPHIKHDYTPPDMKDVTLYIPLGSRETYISFYAGLSKKEKTLPPDKAIWQKYTIRPGDNLGSIARRFGVTVSEIKKMNKMKSSRIIAGRKILVPVAQGQSGHKSKASSAQKSSNLIKYRVKKGETLYSIARLFGVTRSNLEKWNNIKDPKSIQVGTTLTIYTAKKQKAKTLGTKPTGPKKFYIVESGDTFYSIALKLKVNMAHLIDWNGKDPATPRIFPGDTLIYYSETTSHQTTTTEVQLPTNQGPKQYYTVQSGDNLYTIGQTIGVTTANLIAWNGKDPTTPLIHPGERLVYFTPTKDTPAKNVLTKKSPAVDVLKYKVKSGDTVYKIARNFGISHTTILSLNPDLDPAKMHPGDIINLPEGTTQEKHKNSSSKTSANTITYKVQKGETLWSISRNFGVTVEEICKASSRPKNSALHPGDILIIPQK